MKFARILNKKWVLIISVFVIGALIATYIALIAPRQKEGYSIDNYNDAIQAGFKPEQTYGSINGSWDAYITGVKAIRECFPSTDNVNFVFAVDVIREVAYDEKSDTWFLYVYPDCNRVRFGGGFGVIMRSDGSVVSCWGES